ncbi:hypothetical protein PV328_006272 [Microctonus aethiopoides]|uniref:Chromo domain-containing protein n=1 Tax=Microctonus aethiopoides TaxID=144406 RepID=A0AA39FNR9_9HYME|nr:hypothetical protein PV328_006272 [Microctonus aethiopoides]
MRRLMKGKRRKSENPSDAESEENGGNAHKSDESEQTKPNDDDDDDDDDGESAPKSKRRSVRGRDNKSNTDDAITNKDIDESELINQENGNAGKNADEKRRKKEAKKATTSHADDEEEGSDVEYEVERIVSHRYIKGRRQFLIRWKGYDEDADTWEDESELNCSKLIDDFLTDKDIEEESKDMEKSALQNSKENDGAQKTDEKLKKTPKNKRAKISKGTKKAGKATKKNNGEKMDHDENDNDNEKQNADVEKKAKKLRGSRQQNDNAKKNNDEDQSDNEDEEFEVEKIIDVYFKKNKSREFLIRWKGFPPSDDTWEPEANLNCPELITKFMEKVENAKAAELRELRTNPSHTKRYTLTMQPRERRHSRRNAGKERTTYHECDD